MSFPRVLLPLAMLLAAGCETLPDTERPNLTEPFVVQRGTTAEEIIAVLGEPDIRKPVNEYSVDTEIWVYQRVMGGDTEMIITGTEERPIYDPIRRQVFMVEFPVYQPSVTANIEVTEILMFKGQVYSWERRTGEREEVEGMTR